MISQVLLFFSALIVSFLITYPIVRILKFFHLTQSIRQEGPVTHQAKAGTPTLGGIGLVLTIIAFTLVFINFEFDLKYLALIILITGFATIGLIDDLIKVIRKQNLGLTFWQKIVAQIVITGLFSLFLISLGHHQTLGGLLKAFGFSNFILFFLLSTFMVVGTANATNLTDGLNGLLVGTGGIAFLFFAVLSAKLFIPDALTFSLISAGVILGFLYYNFPKAQVFLGDVGSLAIGAALAGLALIMHQELRLIVIGGIFVAETLSVILQVTSYKLWKKRIFKMTPLHHHFELLGFKERSIVVGFWVVGIILGVVGVLI
ncbi:MAG: phospho-N-acetylmuramoyl-pentapeptide-transferase [Candidatus Margulisbacteria bacterium]|nr:phospho-N-acetylmuramoyl-pentapeptide-transferase [Candidatus Margulisiibacteriota bacterium]